MIARNNPFRTDRIDGVSYKLKQVSWDQLLRRLRELRYRAAIVGRHGSGKTTLLECIRQRLDASGFPVLHLFLTQNTKQDFRCFPIEACGQMILFDGADLLEKQDWFRFYQATHNAAGLIITSHQEGLLPTLIRCDTSLQLLEEIVTELTGHPSDFPLETLFRQHHGNLRDVLRSLYDLCAGQ